MDSPFTRETLIAWLRGFAMPYDKVKNENIPRVADVLFRRFCQAETETLASIASTHAVSRSAIGRYEHSGLRMLRHPNRRRMMLVSTHVPDRLWHAIYGTKEAP